MANQRAAMSPMGRQRYDCRVGFGAEVGQQRPLATGSLQDSFAVSHSSGPTPAVTREAQYVTPLEVVLTLWRYGHMTEGEVGDWAWKQVASENTPSQELLDLATAGPMVCLKRAEADFSPRPAQLTYEQEFALKAVRASLQSEASVLELARWAAQRAMGEELSDPIVQLSYQWDHLLNDCEDSDAAVALARSALPQVLPRCQAISAELSTSAA